MGKKIIQKNIDTTVESTGVSKPAIITKSFFYDTETHERVGIKSKGIILIVQSKKSEIGIEVDSSTSIITIKYFGSKQSQDRTARVTIEELRAFIETKAE